MSLLDPCQLCGDLGLLSPAPGGAQVCRVCRVCRGVGQLASAANEAGLEDDALIQALGQAAAVRATTPVRR